MELALRKVHLVTEVVHREGGRAVETPSRVAAALAVIDNPLAGRWVDDLEPFIASHSGTLGALLADECLALLGGLEPEAYGKGALVGTAGEIEHGSAILHTLRFGDAIRDRLNGSSLLPAVEKRGATGASFDIPLKHIGDLTVRSHHQTFEVRVPDAPNPDEIVVALALASGGRPQARLMTFAEESAARSATR